MFLKCWSPSLSGNRECSKDLEDVATLALLLMRHTAPSVLVAKGRSGSTVAKKFHAVAHAMRLLVPSLQALAAMFSAIPAWLTDQGTERFFAYQQRIPLLSLVPPPTQPRADEMDVDFAEGEIAEDVDFATDMPAPPIDDEELYADVTGSLEVDDVLHCIHNATKDLARSMPNYSTVVYQCQKLADMLRRKESKERLKATCFNDSPTARTLFHPIGKFSLHVHTERFGTVAAVVKGLLELRHVLEWGWSMAKFNRNHVEDFLELDLAGASAKDEEHDSRIDVVNGAIWSKFFWGYLVGISGLASALMMAIRWCESCPCHWPLLRSELDLCDLNAVKASKVCLGGQLYTSTGLVVVVVVVA